jgi:hypothetical protein
LTAGTPVANLVGHTISQIDFGSYAGRADCPSGWYIGGAWVKYDKWGKDRDNKGVTGLTFMCNSTSGGSTEIVSTGDVLSGSWSSFIDWSPARLVGIDLLVQPYKGPRAGFKYDDTAVNNIAFYVNSRENMKNRGGASSRTGPAPGHVEGSWQGTRFCPYFQYVCGFNSQTEMRKCVRGREVRCDIFTFIVYFIILFYFQLQPKKRD